MSIFPRVKRLLRRGIGRLLRLRGTPEAIGLGVAVGVLVAFTPTLGLHLVIAAAVATLLRASRPAALLSVWITNPATMAAVYTFTYRVGKYFWRGPVPAKVHDALGAVAERIANSRWHEFAHHLDAFLAFGADTYISLWIGGLLVGGVAAAVSYPLARSAARRVQLRRARRNARRRARKTARDQAMPL